MPATETKAFDTLIHNVNIASMDSAVDSNYGAHLNACIGIKDGLIQYIGEQQAEFSARDTIDGQNKWLTPGLIDCHTHLVYGGNRSNEFEMRLNGATYEEIAKAGGGILSTVKATRLASEDELFDSAARRLQSFLSEGVTTLEIKSGYGLDTENELKMLKVAKRLQEAFPVRIKTTFLGAHALPSEFKGDSDGYIELVCNQMIPLVAEQKLADCVDVFCEDIGFSYAQTKRVFETAKQFGLDVKLHAEQLTDQAGAGLAADFKALSADHLEYLSQESIDKMVKNNTAAVLLPGAYYFLRETKLPPIQALRDAGVAIAIASDSNPGSSPSQSLLLMLNMAATLFKMTPLEALQGVTTNAAKALGVESEVGSLEVGKRAEMVLWDIQHPNELTYQLGGNPCLRVFR